MPRKLLLDSRHGVQVRKQKMRCRHDRSYAIPGQGTQAIDRLGECPGAVVDRGNEMIVEVYQRPGQLGRNVSRFGHDGREV
jgi:hypothetical protein